MSGSPGGREQLEQLSEQIEELEERRQQLQAAIEGLREEQTEIDEAIEGLRTLETGSTVQVPVGGGARVRATIDDIEEVAVSLGGGYAAEQDREGAVGALERKKESIDGRIADLEEEIEEVNQESSRLEQQAQEAQQQLMQQAQQQQQGGGLGGGLGGGREQDG